MQNKAGASGALFKNENYTPSKDGVLIYFGSADIDTELDRVEAAGGSIVKPKYLITEEIGHCGVFIDSEGNRIALYCTP